VDDLDELPPFVQLVAHPLRWRLLRELTRSDRAVRELTELVGVPQNLVSYHLRGLRAGGLVSARRSAADGRDTYYAIDLAACAQQMAAAGGALHPALIDVVSEPVASPISARRPPRVLFLCTGNSARSQIAEALLVHLSSGTVEAASAGSHPKALHPDAVRVMRARGIDISGNRTKSVDELARRRFDVVITLCDRVREVCPEFPAHPELVHWSVPDPAPLGRKAFDAVANDLETRIRFLLPTLVPTRRSAHGER
jgi:protein-tyrosine-phosphatase/DNA-binding transcriptional ArsR family regulator